MGLRSPFGYVDYEANLAELFIDILDKLCAHAGITPHPFFYVRHHQKYPYERPKALSDFAKLVSRYKELREARLQKWGLLGS